MNSGSIGERHKSEKAFHDKKFKNKRKKDYYGLGVNKIIFNKMIAMIGNLSGKKAIDFGCGSGWQSRLLVKKGAHVWAFDISEEAVKKTKKMAERFDIADRVHVDQMPAENLTYYNDTFDIILGTAILHHLDINAAIKEIHRVLKQGGKAYFLEPLGYNPLINLFRKMTPNLRTKDETPLRYEHFDIIHKRFAQFKHEEFYLTTIFAFFWYFIIRQEDLFIRSVDKLYKLDCFLLKKFPFLKKYCWYSLMIMEK